MARQPPLWQYHDSGLADAQSSKSNKRNGDMRLHRAQQLSVYHLELLLPPTMADVDLDGIAVVHREDETNGTEGPSTHARKNYRWRGSKNSNDILRDTQNPRDNFSDQNPGNSGVDGSGGLGQPMEGEKEGPISRQEYLRARLYRHYKREAEESDREFMKKYDDDLNTTLIFAGLFSAVTAAFFVLVHADFQPEPNYETNALLRIMIQNLHNTSFDGQAILLASLSVSLLAAFLAMLGKQWCGLLTLHGSFFWGSTNCAWSLAHGHKENGTRVWPRSDSKRLPQRIWKLIPVRVKGVSTSWQSLPEQLGLGTLPSDEGDVAGQSSTHAQNIESERDDLGTVVTEVTIVTTRKRYRVEDV